MIYYRIVTTAIPIVNLKTVFLDICKYYEDSEQGKKLTIFPTEGRRERGGGGKDHTILQIV